MAVLTKPESGGPLHDVCVVGAGPVGLALALEAQSCGLRVLLLEAGAQEPAQSPPDWSGSERVDAGCHAPLELATHWGLGGTSWLWGGRCVPFEAVDFQARPHLGGMAWPLHWAEVEPWYAGAARYLDCGVAEFRRPLPQALADRWRMAQIDATQLERWARQPRLVGSLGAQAAEAAGIDLLTGARVEAVVLDEAGVAVSHLQVHHAGQRHGLRARSYVLAGGALGSTRLLLQLQRRDPWRWGGDAGPLGRCYMGHIMGSIASVVLERPEDFSLLDFSRDADGSYVRRRLTPSAEAQQALALCNTSFYIDNPAFYDERHRNPTLSLVFLALAIPAIGRRLVAEAMRLKHIGPAPRRYGAHVLNVLRRPWVACADVLDILARRYLSQVRKPGFILKNPRGIYALDYHAEQVPNPDSRVRLKNDQGHLEVDFRYLAQDAESVLRAHELLDAELRAAGLGHLEYERPEGQRLAHIQEQASDGFHQIGCTRMSDDPADGVVDRDARVHGLGNLYVASSSIFSTSGEANPTLLATALGLRLAHHLAEALRPATSTRSEGP